MSEQWKPGIAYPPDDPRWPHNQPARPIRPEPSAIPPAVGLCPDHAQEFYVPLELPLRTPFPPCPVPECRRKLVVYGRAGA
jgi:hypothetical protein